MLNVTRKHLSSALGVFIFYNLISFVVIFGFRFIFPPEPPPLPYYFVPWRVNQGLLAFLNLFPALALSALVVPFGFRRDFMEDFPPFSTRFMELVKSSIIAAITAAAIYGLLFFLILPLARDREEAMRSGGRLFSLAKERAEEHAAVQDWPQAVQFIEICDRIWPGSPEMEPLRVAGLIGMEEFNAAQRDRPAGERPAALSGIPGQRAPVTVTEALSMAETARREGRYYDAHWLATLAGRLARPNSIDAAAAARLAEEIWDQFSAITPNARETRAWSLYRLKQDGYEAMISGDWIRAYYTFRDHAAQSPGDPDVVNFLALCERGIAEIAFFTDEMELAVGEILAGAVFSLPTQTGPEKPGGRIVLRISSLSTFPDFSFGVGIEIIAVDRDEKFLYRLEAPYAKILPMTLDTGPRLVLLMRALDRHNGNKRWEPVYPADPLDLFAENPGPTPAPDKAQILLDLGYEDFLILSKTRRGLDSLDPADLFAAEKNLGSYGYIPRVFQAEIIYRLCEPVIFLPITILVIAIGWRFRAKSRPRYSFVPMLAVLPLGFYGLLHFYRNFLNNLAIWTTISFGFYPALALFTAGTVIFFIVSLIILSAQHG